MRCAKCGAGIEDGQVFCPVCGAEIQLVPDFYSLETVTYAQKQKEQREREIREREKRRREEQAALEKKRQDQKRRKKVGITILVLVSFAGVILTFKSYQEMKNYNSFDYQLGKAETMFTNSNYDEALEYAKRAVSLNPDSRDARVLLAQIHMKTNEEEKAISELEAMIAEDPDYMAAYGPLIRLYETEKETNKIKELLDNCKSDKIKEKYAMYICEAPQFSLSEGTYDEIKQLELSSAEKSDTIYYTTDGTEPGRFSQIYSDPITLSEGEVTVKALVINEKGIRSDVESRTYSVTIPAPDPPKLTPSSGSYTTAMDNTKIYVIVPSDCKAYYAFDKTATENDTLYEGPVEMPEGEHTFYAVLVNSSGKVSVAASAAYILTAEEEKDGSSQNDNKNSDDNNSPDDNNSQEEIQ